MVGIYVYIYCLLLSRVIIRYITTMPKRDSLKVLELLPYNKIPYHSQGGSMLC